MPVPLQFQWIALAGGGIVAGACCAAVLAVTKRFEAPVAVLGLVGFTFSAFGLVAIAEGYERVDAALYALAFMTASVGGGWALAASWLEHVHREEITEPPDAEFPRTEGVAVIIASCAEPPVYDRGVTAGVVRSLVDEEMLEVSLLMLPFVFLAQKTRYRLIGGTSPSQGELRSIAEKLELRLEGSAVRRVDWAVCTGARSLRERVLAAAVDGFSRVIVLDLAVAASLHLAAAKREADALRIDARGVSLAYADELSDSERLLEMLAERVMRVAGGTEATGAVLVGRAQPEERSHLNPGYDESENAFLNQLRMRLIERGLSEHNVRIAWAEWRSPDVTSAVRHLAALGCRRVAVLPATFPLDALATRLDLEQSVRQARVDEGVSVITLPAWRDDDAVIEELALRALASPDEG